MRTVTWQVQWDHKEPLSIEDIENERIVYLRSILDIDYDSNYTIEELEEMYDNADLIDHEG